MSEFQARRQALIEILSEEAGKDAAEDRYRVGYIAAVNDLLNISVEALND